MNSLRQQATILRDGGDSYNMIKEKLGVSISTMSYWFSDRPFTPNEEMTKRTKAGPLKNGAARHNLRVQQTIETVQNAVEEIGLLSDRDLWMLGLGLYIGEGSKSIESVRIVNSDPDVIKVSIRWFKEICGVTDENLIISLNMYPDNNEEAAMEYWQSITGLPKINFRKTQIDTRQNKTTKLKRKLPFGTVQIRIRALGDPKKGVILFRRIKGWTKGALNQV